MKRWERIAFNGLGLVVAASGFAYLWMNYAMTTDDPFALVNHPWEPAMLSAHVLTSPAFVLAFGVLLNAHIVKQLRAWRRENRLSGLTSLGTFATMASTGYLLQITTTEALLTALVIVHIASSVIFTLAYVGHLIISLRLPHTRPGTIGRQAA
jgi:hypothetical protein